ncbi:MULTISPECIES: MmcQ/YjbR family DNA-binding protein [Micromonospora]|uniref:MmcQ/YjbR family DNA-binding protein n=1 Tax=Micromonospora antibiotica TaxID=2807623 RepID=A0ABS3VFZ3_9ACTN|nr:MmcQ/YjbR family DNA-binding protein [Micromonospora antibiotica]MBO4164523.1 MmcQ/YjbR family DNA-binding protein [Micromonospora antibiotica]
MLTPDQVRDFALAMPEAVEQETWGHPTFRVRERIFASTSADGVVAIVRASKEDQAELMAADPETYDPADYFGRYGWVRAQLATADPDELRELVVEGWRRAAPKRLVAQYDGTSARTSGR